MCSICDVRISLDACDVYTWGKGTKGMLGHGEDAEEVSPRVVEALLGRDIRKIAVGTSHTVALSSKFSIWCILVLLN